MALKRTDHGRLVYSTDRGRLCPRCGAAVHACRCPKGRGEAPSSVTDGIVRIRRETKGRKGKTVTTVTGLDPAQQDLKALLKQLKQKCGAGGALVEGVLELQGDHRERVHQELEAQGFRVKLAGG